VKAAAAALEAHGVADHYPDGHQALRSVSFAVAAGERVALVGPNGAGKSTLLLHLAGLLPERQRYLHRHDPAAPPHRHGAQGRVLVDGVPLGPDTIAGLRARVGIVFEDPEDQVVGLTVAEDVAYGPRARRWPQERVQAAVSDALAAVGLTGREARFPHHLSSGEKRRLCLAGALACDPGLLLLDEPTSGLDPRGRRELAELLAGLPATLVVASHDLALVERLCPRAIVLDDGVVVADAPTAELLADRARLARHGLA
jgi:energy-coupling factor transporter ATP-binding protein EcfA2